MVDDYLVDPNCTVGYFFFKDDFDDQKSVIGALRCLIHQIFTQRPHLLTPMILERFEANEQLLDSFAGLWRILSEIAQAHETGEIICVLDALDECLTAHREVFIQQLVDWTKQTRTRQPMRILVSSRFYNDISYGFREVEQEIYLGGEGPDEMTAISKEIDLVIAARARAIAPRLQLSNGQADVLIDELR